MTTWPLPRIAAAEPLSTGAKLGRRLAAWADGLRAWAGLLHDLKSVHELDNRMLADIGFTRGDLDRVVRHGPGTDEIRGRAAPIRPTPALSRGRPDSRARRPDAVALRPRLPRDAAREPTHGPTIAVLSKGRSDRPDTT
jgi:uncharacterized protein YjiS (DUF1127 family)